MTAELFTLFLASTVRLAVPLLFAATGELVSERAGVVNMSVEGMMLTGAFGGAMGAAYTGSPMLGLCCAILAVLPLALLQSVMTNTLRANQIVTGIGINIMALGLTTLGYRALSVQDPVTSSPASMPGRRHCSDKYRWWGAFSNKCGCFTWQPSLSLSLATSSDGPA
jgi:ABC-type uncharacterized transport system permease subunit